VASSCFVIVAVAANGLRFGDEVRERSSGAGGFALVAQSDVPLRYDLNGEEGQAAVGLSAPTSALLARSTVFSLRVLPGDDVSCLNLYQPRRPRLLGVPDRLIERGGFRFQALASDVEDPWGLLQAELPDGAVPAFGDANSVRWILKTGLGRDLLVGGGATASTMRVRIVGLLRRSLFQSELLVSERNLVRHFPQQTGASYFLIDTPAEIEERLSVALEEELGSYGFDVEATSERLQRFQEVENTYLATFRSLGGLGLLLGTVGLAVVLLRNVLERRGELATLRAIGFRRASLAWMVLAENSILLVAGMVIGTVSALVAVAPHLIETTALVPWAAILGTLAFVLVVGWLACFAAVRQSLRVPLLPALREE
jgi:hypothetical protein